MRTVQIESSGPVPVATAASPPESNGGAAIPPGLTDVANLRIRSVPQDRYSLTAAALSTLRARNITPHEVQDVLDASPRLTRYVGANTAVVLGVTDAGRHLALLALESAKTNDWDVVAARDMSADEARVFNCCIGRKTLPQRL